MLQLVWEEQVEKGAVWFSRPCRYLAYSCYKGLTDCDSRVCQAIILGIKVTYLKLKSRYYFLLLGYLFT